MFTKKHIPQPGDEIEVIGGSHDGLRGLLVTQGQTLIAVKDANHIIRQIAKNGVRELKLLRRNT